MPNHPAHPTDTPTGLSNTAAGLQQRIAADALQYWERRRIAYNTALALVTGAVFLTHWPQFQRQASVDFFLQVFLLAVLANVAYCAAYPADLFVQRAGRVHLQRRVRTALFAVGTLFASVLAQFIARGMVAGG